MAEGETYKSLILKGLPSINFEFCKDVTSNYAGRRGENIIIQTHAVVARICSAAEPDGALQHAGFTVNLMTRVFGKLCSAYMAKDNIVVGPVHIRKSKKNRVCYERSNGGPASATWGAERQGHDQHI
jgi:hypothetical protein